MINTTYKIAQRNQYKLMKAVNTIIQGKEENMIKPTPQYLISEQKFINKVIPEIFDVANKVCKLKKTLSYYRKKYNDEGVTKIAERFIKSKPFIYAHNVMTDMAAKEVKRINKESGLVPIIPPKEFFGL